MIAAVVASIILGVIGTAIMLARRSGYKEKENEVLRHDNETLSELAGNSADASANKLRKRINAKDQDERGR